MCFDMFVGGALLRREAGWNRNEANLSDCCAEICRGGALNVVERKGVGCLQSTRLTQTMEKK